MVVVPRCPVIGTEGQTTQNSCAPRRIRLTFNREGVSTAWWDG